MSTIESTERIGGLRALLGEALEAADALELDMVAVHVSMAMEALSAVEADTAE